MNNDFVELINKSKAILTEGAIVERLKGEYNLELDKDVMHSPFIYDKGKREVIHSLYKGYVDIGLSNKLPIMIMTPTRRANLDRIKASGYRDKDINGDCVRFLKELRDEYSAKDREGIYIGGLMGCKNDAYKAEEALTSEEAYEFHEYQVSKFLEADVDFILAAVLPSKSEALGIAKRISESKMPYVLSFVIRESGRILDGTRIHDVIVEIDSAVKNKPLFYMVNCVHPEILLKALAKDFNQSEVVKRRLLGIQANASKQSPEELEGGNNVILDSVENLVEQLMNLHNEWNIKILGGCCGTDNRHIEELAKRVKMEKIKGKGLLATD